jgi:predicted DNA-binding transcriptional regulator AlpA
MSNTQRAAVPDTTRADDELLTMQEVAVVVRVPVATLRYWRHLGTGPRSFRIGRGVRYWRTEVFAWLDDQAKERSPERRLTLLSPGRGGVL